jgi:ubiquinone/menaquinone biosynthesis C-methylase UbiE
MNPSQAIKERSALKYWKDRKEREGVLKNKHYEQFYTKHFGVDYDFYKDKAILDIGCGARGSLEWADMAKRRVGMDPLADEYVKLEGKNHKMEYKKGYSENIPFPDNSFDVVCSFNSFDHVDNLEKSIKEIGRVVKPGGYFLLLPDIHEKPTVREPQVFSWDVVKKFTPPFELLEEKHYEKSEQSRGMYEGILANVPFDHANPSGRYGIISAKFRKK